MDLFACPVFHPNVQFGCGVIANDNGGEPGSEPGLIDLLLQDLEPFFLDFLTIEDHIIRDKGGSVVPSHALLPLPS